MTKDEMIKLATMLDAFFQMRSPERRVSENEKIFYAYYLALEPYTYAQAREGVISYARKNSLRPSPAEIIACIPQDENAALWGSARPKESIAWMKPHVEALAQREKNRVSVSRYARGHGLTWEEAKKAMEVGG